MNIYPFKRIIIILAFNLLIISVYAVSAAPLQQLSGYNGEVRSLVMSDTNPGLIWAGTYGG